jgi:hypothetical protein
MTIFFGTQTFIKLIPLYLLNACAKLGGALVSRRYSFAGLIRAYAWLVCHPAVIARKRRTIRDAARVPERDVTTWMTSDLTNGEGAAGRWINTLAHLYFRVMGIRTLEDIPQGTR